MLKKTLCLVLLCKICVSGAYMSSARYLQLQEEIEKVKAQTDKNKNWTPAAKAISEAYKGVSYLDLTTRIIAKPDLENKDKAALLSALLKEVEFSEADKRAAATLDLNFGSLPKRAKDRKEVVDGIVVQMQGVTPEVFLYAVATSQYFDAEKGEILLAVARKAN